MAAELTAEQLQAENAQLLERIAALRVQLGLNQIETEQEKVTPPYLLVALLAVLLLRRLPQPAQLTLCPPLPPTAGAHPSDLQRL